MAVAHVLVFAGGDPTPPADLAGLPAGALVVAADSGAAHAVALGRHVDLLVGDLDSIDPVLAEELEATGTEVRRYPAAKDRTDLALALDVAVATGAGRVTVVGGHGGRLDHFLANIVLLGADEYAGAHLDARMGGARVTIVRGRRELSGAPGDLVSLLALGGAATGVCTEGLLFPLQDATLSPGTSLGVSNEMTARQAVVTVATGVVVAVQPGERGVLYDRGRATPP